MPAPTSADDLLGLIRKSNLIEPARFDGFLAAHPDAADGTPAEIAKRFAAAGLLTGFHVEQLLKGKHRGYFLGKYKLLDKIGVGGMGQVFLAEHTSMRRRVAVKVLPPDLAANEFAKERFLREARAAGSLDHPNLVRAYDVDAEGDVVYLVMEYIDGISLHDLVTKFGPLDPARAAYYLWQAANGLGYVHTAGLVHRDIKPANLLVDRAGTVKILDLGLVRALGDETELTRGQGVKILGTADFLAPEQAIDCSSVDIRADIYSLGATAYFLLTGQPPYPGEKVAAKLIAHQVKPIPRAADARPGVVPRELSEVIARMMAKRVTDRFQSPAEVALALEPWAHSPPAPPVEGEIPAMLAGILHPGSAVSIGSMPTRARPSSAGGVATASGGSGSNIRYYAPDSGLIPRQSPSGRLIVPPQAAIPTPPPGPVPTPPPGAIPALKPPARSAASAPPVLPATATHGLGADPIGDQASGRLRNPFKPSAPPPAPAGAPSRARRGVGLVVAALLLVGLGAWTAVATGMVAPPAGTQTAGKPK